MDATTTTSVRDYMSQGWRPPGCDRIALVLQGGGALGAYQAGVYQALHEAEHRAGLGVRRLDRRHQLGDHRRQSRRPPARPAAHVLGDDHRAQDLALHARRRRLPQGAQRRELVADDDAGPARLLRAALAEPVVQPPRRPDRDELLRHRAAARHAGGARRFLHDQREAGPLLGRRRQRAQRQLRLFRQRDARSSDRST